MANAYDLSGILELDAGDFTSGAEEAADASAEVADTAGDAESSLWDLEPAGVAAGGALAGIGTGAQGLLDDTREMRTSLDRMAQTLGISSDEAQEMARSMSDATFPIEEATAAMDDLSSMLDDPEEMEEVAMAADDIADATGTSADAVTSELAPAVNALDGDLDAITESADAFTYAARNTQLEVEDIGSTMERLDFEEIEDMGLQAEEVTGLIAQFGDETGYSGRQLRSNFNAAVREADGDLDELLGELDLGEDALEDWSEEIEEAEGITEDHAEAVEDNVSTMDRIRAATDDAKLAMADYLGPLDAAAPALQAVGITAMAMSTINFSMVIPSIIGIMTALTPLLPILLGLGAIITAVAVAHKRGWIDIHEIASEAIGIVTSGVESLVGVIDSAFDTISYILFEWDPRDTLSEKRDDVLGVFGDIRDGTEQRIEDGIEWVTNVLRGWNPYTIVSEKRDDIMEALPSISDFRDRAENLVDGFTDGVRDSIPDAEGAVDSLTDSVSGYLPGSDAEKGELSSLTDMGRALPETAAAGVEQERSVFTDSVADMAEDAVDGDVSSSQSRRARSGSGATSSEFERALERTDRTDEIVDTLERMLRVLEGLGDELNVDVTVEESGRYDPF